MGFLFESASIHRPIGNVGACGNSMCHIRQKDASVHEADGVLARGSK